MKISSHLFHIVEQPVRDLLCWLWFLILCKLPLFTFPPSSLNLNLYVLNSRSHDCGSIRPIQPKTMDAASPMVWWAVKYQVGWLSTHCSYSNPSSRKPCQPQIIGFLAEKGQKFSLEGPEKKKFKRLLLEIFATVVDVLAELCLNKNWERLRWRCNRGIVQKMVMYNKVFTKLLWHRRRKHDFGNMAFLR